VWSKVRREVESEIQLFKVCAHSDSVARPRGVPPGFCKIDQPLPQSHLWPWRDDRVNDEQGIGPATGSGQPVIRGADHRVLVAVRPVFEEVAGIADDFCREHLDDEYAQLSVALTAKLARKRPSPLSRGDRRIWASAVIYPLGRVNFLSDPSQTPHLPTEHLARLLEVKQTTMAARGRAVMDLLGLDHFGTEFCLPSRLASRPSAWLITIDGVLYDARTLPIEIQAELGGRRLIPGVLIPSAPTPPNPE
jgi:hypothetical protein